MFHILLLLAVSLTITQSSVNVEAISQVYQNDAISISSSPPSNIVICGDSRVVGLAHVDGLQGSSVSAYGKSGVYFHAKVGQGLEHIRGSYPTLLNICNKDTILYVALGVNDLYNIDDYLVYYNDLKQQLGVGQLIICQVGSVNEALESEYGYSVKQSDIDDFNKKLINATRNYKVLDIWYDDESLYTVDGLHYTHDEYVSSLNKILGGFN